MATNNHISASLLESLVKTAPEELQAGADRVKYFLDAAANSTPQEVQDAIRDFKAAHKVPTGEKTKTGADKMKTDPVIQVRSSEFSTIYWAFHEHCSLEGMGYHAAVQKAREFLKSISMRSNGKPILSDDDKVDQANHLMQAKAAGEADLAVGGLDTAEKLQAYLEAKASNLAKLQAEQAALAAAAKFKAIGKLVESIWDEGEEYAKEVFFRLGDKFAIGLDSSPDATMDETTIGHNVVTLLKTGTHG